ncbi:MAG: HD domain-containing protein [Deltaproteobacteria bacterium]|nr:HD domain-containing protein [Deltaproteobacteria bacterium]
MKSLVNFLFEVGMLKKTPRSGYQFLGSGKESVAEHSFRTAIIGYVLSLQEPGADSMKILLMCLFHDLHEARTGDHNYVNKRYVFVDENKATRDLAGDLPFGKTLHSLAKEFLDHRSVEARISRDADQLDLILALKEQLDLGNAYARDWLHYALQRLRTEGAKKLAQEIMETDSAEWWFEKNTEWWVNGPENAGEVEK